MQGRSVSKRGENLRKHWAAAALAGAVAVGTACASAGTYTWVGGNPGDPTIYNEAANWNPNLVPGSSDVAFFDAGTNNQTPTLNADTAVGELDFNTAGWTLGGTGTTLTLNGGTTDATNAGLTVGILSAPTSGTNTISTGLAIAAAQYWEVGTGGTLNVTGPVSGSGALTIGATGYTGAVNFSQQITYAGLLTASGSSVTLGGGWQPASIYAGTALQVLNNGSVTIAGTSSITTNNTNSSPSGYILDNVAGTMTVNSGATLNLSVASDTSGSTNEHLYLYNGPNSTITNNGTIAFSGRPLLALDAGSAINNNGIMTFAPAPNATGGFLNVQMANGAEINVGNPANNPLNSGASLSVTHPSGMHIGQALGGGAGYLNVYGSFSMAAASPTNLVDQFDLGSNAPGMTEMNVFSGGTATIYELLLGDNGSSAPTPGIGGAIYLNTGSTLNVTASVVGSNKVLGNSTTTGSFGVFSIGDGGSGNGGSAANNDFGYVYVAPGASIGPTGGTFTSPQLTNVPGEIDVAGSFRSTSGGTGGGNGLMDVAGTVTINAYLSVASTLTSYNSTSAINDQQFGVLNLLPGSTLTLNEYGQSNAGNYFNGQSNVALAMGTQANVGVLNVLNATMNNAVSSGATGGSGTLKSSNAQINLAGVTGGGSQQNQLASGLMTGMLNINASGTSTSIVRAGQIRSGDVTFPGTPNNQSSQASASGYISGQSSSYLNFSGGTLQYDNGAAGTLILDSIAGAYVYGSFASGNAAGDVYRGGATVGLFNAPGATSANPQATIQTGLDAPPGQGISSIAVTSGGSGYLTPPIVQISDASGFDASAYAEMSYVYNAKGAIIGGSVKDIVVTSPGFNVTNPTITLIGGGGGSGATTSYALANNTSGGLIVNYVNSGNGNATGVLTLDGTWRDGNGGAVSVGGHSTGNVIYSLASNGTQAPDVTVNGAGLGNDPYSGGMFYGNTYDGIRNNTSTYTGPTVIEGGTLQLKSGASSSITPYGNTGTQFPANAFPAVNNNIPFSPAIVVGDTAADATTYGTTLDISTIGGSGGFQLSPGLTNGNYTTPAQVLAGFGTVKGSNTVGLTIGLATGKTTSTAYAPTNPTALLVSSTGNNFGGFLFANGSTSAPTVNNSTVSPGYTANGSVVPMGQSLYVQDNTYGQIVIGTTTSAPAAFSFNTQQGNAKTQKDSSAVGTLTLGGNTSTTTTFGAGGVYYWKLDLTTGGAGAASGPGVAASASAPYIGMAWDNLAIDNLAVTSTSSNAFTIQAVSFNSTISGGTQIPVSGGTMPAANYSWVVAQVRSGTVAGLQSLMANLSLNTTGLPTPAAGYQYFLNAQSDPGGGAGADLVVNYAPVPEPTGLALLGMGAGAMMVRRRRRVGAAA